MKRFITLPILASLLILLCGRAISEAKETLRVAATLSTFADLVKTIGGEQVEVSAVASPKFDPHFIEPKPSDVLKVKRADLFVHGGLDLEAWRGPLLDAAGNPRLFPGGPGDLALSTGITLLEVPTSLSRAQGDIHMYGNPHYWTSPDNGRTMAQTLCDKLCAMDPAHEHAYRQRLSEFLARLDGKLPEWKAALAPYQGRELVGDHRAWSYLASYFGITIDQYLEPKPGIPPTPKQIEFLESYIRQRHIPAIVRAGYFPPQAPDALAKRTGVRVVQLCQNVGELPACSDYIAMVDYNVHQLASIFTEAS